MKLTVNNNNNIFLKNFNYGKTQNIEVKVGRKFVMLDINKCNDNAIITIYNKLNTNRGKYSKYDHDSHIATIIAKSDALLNRDFFENAKEIAKAKEIIKKYNQILYL